MSYTEKPSKALFASRLGLLVLCLITFVGNAQSSSDSEVAIRIAPVGKVATGPEPAVKAEVAVTAEPSAEGSVATPEPAAETEDAASPEPAAETKVAASPEPAATGGKSAEQIYQTSCLICHLAGVANAPKISDTAEWQKRYAQGMDTLVKNATTGKGAMPPRGGTTVSDEELRSVIEYILKQAGIAG